MSKVLITGCGRSGTSFIAEALSDILGDGAIGHECRGIHGMASWLHGVDTDIPPPSFPDKSVPTEPSRQSRLGDTYQDNIIIVHQVRDPILVIRSLKSFKPESWRYISSIFPEISTQGTIEDAIKYYIMWNKAVEKNSVFTYRIEDLCSNLRTFEKFAQIIEHPEIVGQYQRFRALPQDVNKRTNHWAQTFDDIIRDFPALANELQKLSQNYGYSLGKAGLAK